MRDQCVDLRMRDIIKARGIISIGLTLVAITALTAAIAHASESHPRKTTFVATGAPHPFRSARSVYEFIFEARRGPSPFDRIALHRITRGPVAAPHPNLVMLYLPGTNMNGQVAIDNPRYSLPLYLAMRGVDVWALDYRTHFVPPSMQQDSLSELKNWSNELFEADIDAAVSFIASVTGRKRIFVAGFSRGVEFAYLYAADPAHHVQGLVLFDGWIGHGRTGAPSAGVYADDVAGKHLTWEKRQALLNLVIENPDAPAPLPKYKNAADNLNHVVFDSSGFGGKGGLANPFAGFSDPSVLARVLVQYDRYWPAVQDYEDSFDARRTASLAGSKIRVLAFASTNIAPDWPQRVAQSAASTGSSDVTVKTLKGWGHLDVICGTHAEAEVFAPTLAWLTQHRK